MEKKYYLTGKSSASALSKTPIYRIIACRDIMTNNGLVKKGELGGYVSSEKNLSQEGSCWIFDNAKVIKDSSVSGNAIVAGNSIIVDSAIYDSAIVKIKTGTIKNSVIHDNALIDSKEVFIENSTICDFAVVEGGEIKHSVISNYALIKKRNVIIKESRISDYAIISGSSTTYIEKSTINKKAHIVPEGYDMLHLCNCKVTDNAKILSSSFKLSNCEICNDAEVGKDITGNLVSFSSSFSGINPIILDDITIAYSDSILIIPAIAPSGDCSVYYYGENLPFPEFYCKNTFPTKHSPHPFSELTKIYLGKMDFSIKTIPTTILNFLQNNDTVLTRPCVSMEDGNLLALKNKISKIKGVEIKNVQPFYGDLYLQAMFASIAKWGSEFIFDSSNKKDLDHDFNTAPLSWQKFLSNIVDNADINILTNEILDISKICFYDEFLVSCFVEPGQIEKVMDVLSKDDKSVKIPDFGEYIDTLIPF